MFLVSDAISEYHVMKGLCDFLSGSRPSCQVITMPSLVAIGIVVVGSYEVK